ncbi:hypothetical protein K7432_006449 [Basidiobolus ranarum]|uniref:F-box domain-containing protein n=1 Tax=Basidiobolus ranarum TaxID=34480 RepID=A0ABR2WUV4_9FUNG
MIASILPSEVLKQIFELFAKEDDHCTLYSCTLVCHLWHPLANCILWRKPVMGGCEEYSLQLQSLILSSSTHAHWIQEWSSRNLPATILPRLRNLKKLPEIPARSLQPLVSNGVPTDIRFIRKLNSRGNELLLLIEILKLCPYLEEITIRIFAIDVNTNIDYFERLSSMSRLVRLTIEFEDFDMGDFGASFIESVTTLTPNLKQLSLKTGTFAGHRLLGITERCSELDSLSFEYWHDPNVEAMTTFVEELAKGLGHRLRHFSVIQRESLHLWGIGLNEESFTALTTTLSHSLSRLTFYRSPSSDDSDMENVINSAAWEKLFSACASNLVELNLLAFRPFPPSVSRVISEGCPNLKSLSITSEDAEFICPILGAYGPQLTSLELIGCKLGVETLNTVFKCCRSLTKLVFMHSEIGGSRPLVHQKGISNFLQKVGPRLQSLIITGTLISSHVLEEIRVYCKELKHLDLTQVASIDEKLVVADFKASLMNLKWIKINGKGVHCGIKPHS